VRAANRENARSQDEFGYFHLTSARRLDILQGAPAEDHVTEARWAEALRFLEMAAEQGFADAQKLCGLIYANGGRSVLQNWATAVKWWRKAAEAGDMNAQWLMGQCSYYGRGLARNDAQANVWFRKSAAQEVRPVEMGIPGEAIRQDIVRFTDAGSAPIRHAIAHQFAGKLHELYLKPQLRSPGVWLCRAASSPCVTACRWMV
jgi:TPR repeat protein